MYRGKKVSLVIPAYNEEKLIRPTLLSVPDIIDRVYVIDDCSKDNMVNVVKEIASKDKRIELIQHEKNKGVGQGIITGYLKSNKDGYDVAVVIGGDNQMDLKDLPNFLESITKGEVDYVKGNRFLYAGGRPMVMPFKRLVGNSILSLMVKIASGYYSIFDTQEGYTAITKEAIDKVNWDKAWKGYGYPGDFLILFNAYGLRVKDVPRRAIYLSDERQSQIKILSYIWKVGPLYVKKFFWRLGYKYIMRDFHPLVFFYMLSFVLLPIGILLGVRAIWFAIQGPAPTNETILSALSIMIGFLSLLFAMFFDMQNNQKLQP